MDLQAWQEFFVIVYGPLIMLLLSILIVGGVLLAMFILILDILYS